MQHTAQLRKMLSEGVRLRIIHLLSSGELPVCELIDIFELPQSTVSRHHATLRNFGLVNDHRKGVWMYYRMANLPLSSSSCSILLHSQLADLPQGQANQQKLVNRLRTATRCGDAPQQKVRQ